jgi:methionyl-tRNA synthetase
MNQRILVAVAWPYANGSLHLGQIAGAYLPADIFARYHRLKGNQVLMVSGSDQHGTPITLRADEEGREPGEIAARYHKEFLESWQRLGISFDLFTTTGTENHAQVTQDIFLKLMDRDYIYKSKVSQPYCPQCRRYLPDRYIEGTCPFCGSANARGDQCDDCGKPINPEELVDPRCRLCGGTPQFQDSEHFFFKLSDFQRQLGDWVKQQSHWRPNVVNLTKRYLKEGLRDRAITRDIGWGVPVPVEGYEDKRIYVWFEAVIGYLSASKEWAKAKGGGEGWRDFWEDKGAHSYYFIGKDNIPFHTIIWPAMLMGYEGLNLPYDVPANEFLTIEGRKLSTSRNWAVWLPEYLDRYEPDPLRYLLSINMPENGDTDFSWREFVRRNNDELVATYGNLVNRVLTFVYKNFEGRVPTYADMGIMEGRRLTPLEEESLAKFNDVGNNISQCHFKAAITLAMSIAHQANRYLEEASPWKVIKEDRQAAANSLYLALNIISQLRTMLYPFLPFSSQRLHDYLGFAGKIEDYGWNWQDLPAGQKLPEPKPLFTKLDDKLVEEETARLGQ